jgi:hypothetical protein
VTTNAAHIIIAPSRAERFVRRRTPAGFTVTPVPVDTAVQRRPGPGFDAGSARCWHRRRCIGQCRPCAHILSCHPDRHRWSTTVWRPGIASPSPVGGAPPWRAAGVPVSHETSRPGCPEPVAEPDNGFRTSARTGIRLSGSTTLLDNRRF